MAKVSKKSLENSHVNNKQTNPAFKNIIDSVQLLSPGENTLPTSDPAVAGDLFITGSTGANLGDITGSGFALLCVSQG
tara:strand:- start:218 stop:451 length:234 start_codon:yes stop_codon:yes gene_type:complete